MALKIAIIGAGPAGCALARLIQHSDQKHNISVTIFEAEASLDFRSQGGTLDLHVKTGQACLKAAGLFEEFEKHARYDGEAMNICDKKLLSYIKQGASKKGSITGRPEIDRPKLRELLYNSLEPGTVRWSRKLTHVSSSSSTSSDTPALTLHFASGETETNFHLIVGADGAWSKVRPLVSNAQPFYSGIAGHALRIPSASTTAPELYALVNRGSLFSFSDGKSIMAQYMGDDSINIGTWAVRPSDWQQEFKGKDADGLREMYKREYSDWDSRLVAFTQEAEGRAVPRELFMLPVGHSWANVLGVTLIGDAAHVATPFAGEGVNLALEDSLKLSGAIISAAATASSTPDAATEALRRNVADFEKDMFRRATEMQQLTVDMMEAMFFVPGAPRNGIEKYICRAVEGEFGYWLTLVLLKPLVYVYFFFFKLIY